MRKLPGLVVLAVGLAWTCPVPAATPPKPTTVHQVTRPKARFVGVASWYGKAHQGKRMANGERFNRRSLTAACRSLPLGTKIRVVNLENGNAVDVTVTDRGPARRLGRVLDLSEAAARQLHFIGEGEARVFFFVLPEPKAMDLELQISDPQTTSLE